MSSINTYYQYDHSLTPYYASLIALDNHLANTFFHGDLSRIITASNDYALRKRSNQNKDTSGLNLPFLNYKRTDWEYDRSIGKWSNPGFAEGIFLDDIGKKVKILPVVVDFQSILWFSTEHDIAKAYHLLRFDSDGLTELEYILTIDGVDIPMWIWFTYKDAAYDPAYNESDWLEQNKIHTVSLNFTAHFFDIEVVSDEDANFSITEEVLFEFAVKKGLDTTTPQTVHEEVFSYLQEV